MTGNAVELELRSGEPQVFRLQPGCYRVGVSGKNYGAAGRAKIIADGCTLARLRVGGARSDDVFTLAEATVAALVADDENMHATVRLERLR